MSLMGSGDERRQYDGTFGMARMQTMLIHFIVFVEFHPFSEGLARWRLHAARARIHTSTLVFLVEESPDLCPGLQAQKASTKQ